MRKKASIELKILFFGVGLIIFFAATLAIYTVISKNKNTITSETESTTDCLYLNFVVSKPEYSNNTLSFMLTNPGSNKKEITQITLNTGENDFSKNYSIKNGEAKEITFEDVTLNKNNGAAIYANGCRGFEKPIILS